MPGLEHLPGAPFAETLQDDVRAQEQVLAAPEQQLIDLIGSEPAPLQQFLAQRPWVREAPLSLSLHEFTQLRRTHEWYFPQGGQHGRHVGKRRDSFGARVDLRRCRERGGEETLALTDKLLGHFAIDSRQHFAQLVSLPSEPRQILRVSRSVAPEMSRAVFFG